MNQVLVTLENDVSNIEQAFIQQIAQEMALVRQQLDHLLGIDANTSSTSSKAAVSPTNSSSGAGNVSRTSNVGPIAGEKNGSSITENGSSSSRTKPRAAADTMVQPLTPSGDTDGSGNVNGGLSGQFGVPGDVMNFTNGVISNGLSGTFTGTGHITGGFPSHLAGTITIINGTLGDSSTFTGSGSFTGSISGTSFSGTFQFTGTSSEGDNISGSGSFSGTVDSNGNITSGSFTSTLTVTDPTNNDTLIWNPQGGSADAADERNWYDQTQGKQGILAPGAGNSVIFDGMTTSQTPYDTSPITWTSSVTVASMTLENGYTAQQTINSGVGIDLAPANGNALNMDGTSGLNLNLVDATSTNTINGTAVITNMNVIGNPSAQFIINSGTTTMADNPGAGNPAYTENLGVQLVVNKGATLKDLGYNALTFTASNLVTTIKGEMDVYYGTGTGITLIQPQNQNVTGCYIDVTGGTLKYTGFTGVKDTFALPVLVENSGTFNVTTKSTSSGGYLIVKGQVQATQKYSVYMTGTSSSVNLSNQTTLECDDDYKQDSGTLQTTDSSKCTLQDGPMGLLSTAVINGGSLVINGGASSGNFTVTASNLTFAGTFKVGIQGDKSGQQGQLNVSGNMNLQGNNVLTVKINGQLNNGNWTIIDTGGNNIAQFAANTNPPTLTGNPNKPNAGDYQVTSP
jgi:hypothetical protein